MRCTSGLFSLMALAICFISVVLPALGGETISPRCPFPMGHIRSMIRVEISVGLCSRRSRSSGYSGVRSLKSRRARASSGSRPLTLSTRERAAYFSESRGSLTVPSISSPRRRPIRRIIDRGT